MKLFIKRLVLIILGIVLSLILLECGLRFAGWTIFSYQQYKNNKALRNKSQYTIMCLGESTTAGEYPIQLQQILDEKYPNKFSVVDCGLPSIHLKNILDNIDNNINKYVPDITICMMGINDMVYNNADNSYTKKSSFISKFKTYKLFILLKQHIFSLLKIDLLYADDSIDITYIIDELDKNFFSNNYENVILLSEKLLKENFNEENNDNEKIYFYYINSLNQYSYRCHHIEHSISEEEYTKYKRKIIEFSKILINKKCNDELLKNCYLIIFFHGNQNEKKVYANKLVEQNLDIINSNLYFMINKYIENEQKEKIFKFLENNKSNDVTYGFLAINALEQKEYKKAQEYFNKCEDFRLHFPNEETYMLYKLIVKKLIGNNIKVICMQYPVRSIKSLQEQLKNEPFYDKITFISNEKLFKKALMKKNYNEVFSDQFAGDFGHCTELGNMLIAKNVVNTLEKMLDLKNNNLE